MVNEIKKIIDNYVGVSWLGVEDNGEGTLIGVSVDYVDTLQFNEETYNKWEEFLDSVDIIKPTYISKCFKENFTFFYLPIAYIIFLYYLCTQIS